MIRKIVPAIGLVAASCASAPAAPSVEPLVVVVATVHVRPESRGTFEALSRELVRQSRREVGVRRFDLLQSIDGADRYVFVEVFVDVSAHADHMARSYTRDWFEAMKGIVRAMPSVDVFDASIRAR